MNFNIFPRNGLVNSGAIFRNEITVTGPVRYAISVEVDITLAKVPQDLNIETINMLSTALIIIATRGVLYFY